MLGILSSIKGMLGIGSKITDTAARIHTAKFGDKATEEAAREATNMALIQRDIAEIQASGTGIGGRFASIFSRLVRPIGAFMALACLFPIPMFYPSIFLIWINNLKLIPSEAWWVLGSMVLSYYTARSIDKMSAVRNNNVIVRSIKEQNTLNRQERRNRRRGRK